MKKSKFFNNSTNSKDIDIQALEQTEEQTSSKSKRKVLRGFAFGGVALMMATAGVFAFAPLGVSADQMNTSASGEKIQYAPSPLGLDPENDPVIYTTESGLEIKWSNDTSYTPALPGGQLTSGALNGYPYFTMGTYSNYAVNWVIIGRNADVTDIFTKPNTSYVFSSWKTTHNKDDASTDTKTNAYYFFNNTYENTSPAGAAVDATIASTSYVSDLRLSTFKPPVTTTEIPSGHVLCVSECYLGASKWSSSDSGGSDVFNSSINSRYSTITGTITAAQKARIKDNKFFGFSYGGSFSVTTYLTTNALRVAYNIGTTTAGRWWTSTASHSWKAWTINTNGALMDSSYSEGSYVGKNDVNNGIRPVMLYKL